MKKSDKYVDSIAQACQEQVKSFSLSSPMGNPKDLIEQNRFQGDKETFTSYNEVNDFLKHIPQNTLLEVRVNAGPYAPFAIYSGTAKDITESFKSLPDKLLYKSLYPKDIIDIEIQAR